MLVFLSPVSIYNLFSFNLNMQLPVTLQNVNEVNREALSPWAASSVYDSTKHNDLVTMYLFCQINLIGGNHNEVIF